METNLSYITVALAAATLLVAIYLAIRLKAVLYLLQQPVVKKMSPQLRLKPVKLDEALDRNRARSDRDRQGAPGAGREGERRDGRDRGPRPEGDRGPRAEGDRREGGRDRRDGRDGRRDGRPERSDRPEGDRGPRPEGERREGGRDRRDGDRNRDGRGERRDGNRSEGNRDSRPPREFSETRDAAPAAQSSDYSAPAAEAPTGLPPRRPLPSFADTPSDRHEEASAPARESSSNDGFVGSSGDDMQHGRRTQLKKKPRFDFDEEEAPTT